MKRLVAWFGENPVAANLLMAVIVAGGVVALPSVPQTTFPDIDIEVISIGAEYLGAAPEEVEEGVCIRIEEAIDGVQGIEKIRSTAQEGACAVFAELISGTDPGRALDEIKNRIDGIDTFPEEVEKPIIEHLMVRRSVADIAVSGPADERALKVIGQRVRDELAALPEVSQVSLASTRAYEISIEVSEEALRRHGLDFDQVAHAVRRSSLDLPGGSVKTGGGEILLRTKGQAYRGHEFERIVVLTHPDGTRLLLGDVATVVDGFEDVDRWSHFDGSPAVIVRVSRVGDQDSIEIMSAVERYVATARESLPEGFALTIWQDATRPLRSRIDTLLRNGRSGLLLVLLLLTLFLRPRLAFWVTFGVPIAFLGGIWMLPLFDISISVISLFGFIIVIGILVDDAVVIGENVYTHGGREDSPLRAAIAGTQEVSVPVVFGVLTTVAAFSPLLAVPGPMGQIFTVMAIVVIGCLLFSLVESQLVLPRHLGHTPPRGDGPALALIAAAVLLLLPVGQIGRAVAGGALLAGWLLLRARGQLAPTGLRLAQLQERFSRGLEQFAQGVYRPLVARAAEWRYLTVAAGIALLLGIVGVIASGRMHFSFFPPIEADYVAALVTMPEGAPVEVTAAAVRHIERSIGALAEEIDPLYAADGGSLVKHVLATVGAQPFRTDQSQNPQSSGRASRNGAHMGEVVLELIASEERSISTSGIADRWREIVGPIPEATELVFAFDMFSAGEAIDVQLKGPSVDDLRAAADRVKQELEQYPGVVDIADSFRAGKQEVVLSILPEAEPLGLTLRDLARQVRQAFYGEEVQRIQRGRDDVRVMVRYPSTERRSLGDLENMWIRAGDGSEVPFRVVAHAELGRGFAAIRRSNRQRVVDVTADVDRTLTTANDVLAHLKTSVLPEILPDYAGMSMSLEGEQREQQRTLASLAAAYGLALVAIYVLLAVPLRSYAQPLVIMSVIPFGLVGAIGGHLLMGRNLSFMSVVGIVALSGVVVNASLVLVDFVNRGRAEGMPVVEALQSAAVARFRPILLTALTTFVGLTPLMLERSVQAQFLVPMAISLAFGVVFATAITLLIVPAGYLILQDLGGGPRKERPDRQEQGDAPDDEAPRREKSLSIVHN